MTDTILWRRLDLPGHEVGRLRPLGARWELSGTALFLHEARPCRLEYRVACDPAWRTESAWVQGAVGDRDVYLRVAVEKDRRWRLNGADCPGVAGCLGIDLGFATGATVVQGPAPVWSPEELAAAETREPGSEGLGDPGDSRSWTVHGSLLGSPGYFVEHRRRRRCQVERLDAAAHRHADPAVAQALGALAQALLLAAEAQQHLTGQDDLPGRLAAGHYRVRPEALGLEPLDRLRAVDHPLDRQPLDRPGRRLGDHRGERRRAAVADQQPAHSGRLADADQGAEIARVLDVLDQHHQVVVGTRPGRGRPGARPPRRRPQFGGEAVVHRRPAIEVAEAL